MAIGKQSNAYEMISNNLKGLTDGLIVAIDPSVGSGSSMPGFSIYRAGELIDSGILEIKYHRPLPDRLRELANRVRKLYLAYPPDILVYEEVPVQRYGGGNATAQASLLKALGVILSVAGPSGYVGIPPVSWKAAARDTYVKSDENDAIEIGWVAVQTAREITNSQTKRKPTKQKGKK
jgi:hypothetical protein